MPRPAVSEPLPGFKSVAPSIWERAPLEDEQYTKSSRSTTSPDFILVFSWTGALLRHVSKYTKHYEQLYPYASILLITTTIKDLCWRSSGRKQERLDLAVHRVMQGSQDKRILVHCFSEGGSNKAVEFAEAYFHQSGQKLPVSALCLDSTPGHPRFQKLCGAFSRSLGRNKAIRAVGLVVGTVVLGTFWFSYTAIKGRENNVISKTRARINDDKYWNVNAPRCYLYSEADDMIHWEDIKDHLDEAAQDGIPVYAMQFANSGHCRHIEKATDAYWEAVVETWAKGHPGAPPIDDKVLARLSTQLSRGTSLLFSIDSATEVTSRLSVPIDSEAYKRLSTRISFIPSIASIHNDCTSRQARASSATYRRSLVVNTRESAMDPLSMYFSIRDY